LGFVADFSAFVSVLSEAIFSASQKSLPLQGAGNHSEVGLPVSTCGGVYMMNFGTKLLK